MLINCLIWTYIFFTTFALGTGLLNALGIRKDGSAEHVAYHVEDICMTGFMFSTVYAQIFSLFGGVGAAANIILSVVSLLILGHMMWQKRKSIPSFSFSKGLLLRSSFLVILILIMAYGASRGYFHYDSDLYHGQAIRWIEEYGVVRGLGLLHGRLAYNSSSFAVQALYSFCWLGSTSYHACAGFVALMVMISGFRLIRIFSDGTVRFSDFCRISAIYYVLNIYDEMNSPASDYFTMLIFFYIVIRLADCAEIGFDADDLAVCACLSIFDITVKMSAAPLAMITLIPFVMLVRKRRIKKILTYAVIVLTIVCPFLIRNYIISGRLFYPSTAVDIFDPDWKIAADSAMADGDYIVAFGRGYSSMDAAHMRFSEWFPHWFSGIGKTWMLFFLLGILGFMIWLVCTLFSVRKKENMTEEKAVKGFLILTVFASFCFWLFSSPLVRYGQGYLLALPAMTFGQLACMFLEKIKGKRPYAAIMKTIIAGFSIFILYKGVMLASYIRSTSGQQYYISSQDYGHYETYPVSIGEKCVIYIPVSGDQTGYDPFPSAPTADNLPKMREPGDPDFSQGFIP